MSEKFKIRDFTSVIENIKSIKEEVQNDYKGFDKYIFNVWMNNYRKANQKKNELKIDILNVEQNSYLDIDQIQEIILEQVLPALKVKEPEKRKTGIAGYNPEYTQFVQNVQKFVYQMVDLSNVHFDNSQSIDIQEVPVVKFGQFFKHIHNLYFEQLMIESQDNDLLDKLLWEQFASSADPLSKKENIPQNFIPDSQQSQHENLPKSVVKIIQNKIDPKIRMTDQGLVTIQTGTIIQKKFKFYRLSEENGEENLCVVSSIPLIVQIKTPILSKDMVESKNDEKEFVFIKFQIAAPITPCEIDAKIIVFNPKNDKIQELIFFQIQIFQ